MSQEAGDESVGELLESVVDLGLEVGKGGGIAGELLGPELLLGGELGLNILEGPVRGRDSGTGLGVEVKAHGKSFRVTPLLG